MTQEKTAARDTLSVLVIPNEDGDLRIEWSAADEAQIQVARDAFDKGIEQGMTAYQIAPGGERGSLIREFDPEARRILLAPQMVGG